MTTLRVGEPREPYRQSETRHRTNPFIRDVLVGVVSNLVTAAIIYLGGAAAGLFPRNPVLGVLSVGIVLFVVAYTLAYRSKYQLRYQYLAGSVVGITMLAMAVAAYFSRIRLWVTAGTAAAGAVGLMLGLFFAWRNWRALSLFAMNSELADRIVDG